MVERRDENVLLEVVKLVDEVMVEAVSAGSKVVEDERRVAEGGLISKTGTTLWVDISD
jgi:hypothetical protein